LVSGELVVFESFSGVIQLFSGVNYPKLGLCPNVALISQWRKDFDSVGFVFGFDGSPSVFECGWFTGNQKNGTKNNR
jgi:hypothetical protein